MALGGDLVAIVLALVLPAAPAGTTAFVRVEARARPRRDRWVLQGRWAQRMGGTPRARNGLGWERPVTQRRRHGVARERAKPNPPG
jgi:hypothetical protein